MSVTGNIDFKNYTFFKIFFLLDLWSKKYFLSAIRIAHVIDGDPFHHLRDYHTGQRTGTVTDAHQDASVLRGDVQVVHVETCEQRIKENCYSICA